jgi:hypothetical protein
LGPFIHAQIVAHQDDPNSIIFAFPDGTKGHAWLASDNDGSRIIGDDRLWRINADTEEFYDRMVETSAIAAAAAESVLRQRDPHGKTFYESE